MPEHIMTLLDIGGFGDMVAEYAADLHIPGFASLVRATFYLLEDVVANPLALTLIVAGLTIAVTWTVGLVLIRRGEKE